jgi:hypothetical protein
MTHEHSESLGADHVHSEGGDPGHVHGEAPPVEPPPVEPPPEETESSGRHHKKGKADDGETDTDT